MPNKQNQLPLFPKETSAKKETVEQGSSLSRESLLSEAIEAFHDHMIHKGFTENTISSFLGDLSIFSRYLEDDVAIDGISTRKLNDFLAYLLHGRKAACTPKSYARRVTTLKVFFGWLAESGVVARDVAAPVIHRPASSPLPRILHTQQIADVLAVTASMLRRLEDPNPRPHLLVSLLLATGMKKGECMRINLADLDLASPTASAVYVRYDNPRRRYKERKLRLPPDFSATLTLYRNQYKPQARLFECTARNLEYVLTDVAQQANLPNGLSFEMLRMTCAVRDYRGGIDEDTLRRKLGLSRIAWTEVLEKIQKLVSPAL